MNKKVIAIIGGGCSGTLAAVHLAREQSPSVQLEIILIERQPDIGLGLAYRVPSDRCKLNVPVTGMSAFPADPEDFFRWVTSVDPSITAEQFVSRRLYGLYLQHLLSTYCQDTADRSFRFIQAEALDVHHDQSSSKVCIHLTEHEPLHVDFCILAFGNLTRRSFCGVDANKDLLSPYRPETYHSLKGKQHILVIGTGLTSVDFVLEAEGCGYAGSYTMVSRHGRIPLPHEVGADTRPDILPDQDTIKQLSLRALTKLVTTDARARGSSQAMLLALRPQLQTIWTGLSDVDKRRFLRHIRPIWEVHRHRIPRPHHDQLTQLAAQGRLSIESGRIRALRRSQHDVVVDIVADNELRQHRFCEAVLCAGPEGDLTAIDLPLIRNLLKRQILIPGKLGLGGVVAPDISSQKRVWLLGPPQRENLWEITAVREIRQEAQALASTICSLAQTLPHYTTTGSH
jgi:uncharacterized NAD(P)/FAD-binding protein YdhS